MFYLKRIQNGKVEYLRDDDTRTDDRISRGLFYVTTPDIELAHKFFSSDDAAAARLRLTGFPWRNSFVELELYTYSGPKNNFWFMEENGVDRTNLDYKNGPFVEPITLTTTEFDRVSYQKEPNGVWYSRFENRIEYRFPAPIPENQVLLDQFEESGHSLLFFRYREYRFDRQFDKEARTGPTEFKARIQGTIDSNKDTWVILTAHKKNDLQALVKKWIKENGCQTR